MGSVMMFWIGRDEGLVVDTFGCSSVTYYFII